MADEKEGPDVKPDNTERRTVALMEVAVSLLELDDFSQLKDILNAERPADVAELLRRMDEDTRNRLFGLLDEELAAETLAESDTTTMLSIVEDLEPKTLSDLVEEMEPDDAADVLSELKDDEVAQVLALMRSEEAQEMQDLLVHEEDTGGGLMTPDFILVHQSATAGDAMLALQEDEDAPDHYYVFVVDDEKRPVGTVSLHKLVRTRPHIAIAQIMDSNVITVRQDTDQEEIARLFEHYNFMAVPVVDENGQMVGRITADDVIDVIEEEATEDIYKMAGTHHDEIESTSVFGVARNRLPWLLICLAGSFLSGGVIHFFDGALAKVIALAAFIPAITATGGNSGLQSSTVTVRSLVTGHVSSGMVMRTIFREIGTAMVIGLACGLAATGMAWFWFGEKMVGLCVGLAMFLAISVAVTMGVIVPIFLNRMGIDPAIASGPFITTTNDILGLFIYLGLATLLMQYLS